MRLTADLILRSPAFINPVKERELDLRANKIPIIENLGVTQDQYDAIDLSDNEIGKLENFPALKRLRTLFLNNNRVSKIAPNLASSIPNLEWLVLANNRIAHLEDLEPLSCFKKLRALTLLDNPVTKLGRYRLFVIHTLPSLRLLDFRKVKMKERRAARQLFAHLERNGDGKFRTFTPGGEVDEEEEAKRAQIRAAIANVNSVEEAQLLEAALASGDPIPKELLARVGAAAGTSEGGSDAMAVQE